MLSAIADLLGVLLMLNYLICSPPPPSAAEPRQSGWQWWGTLLVVQWFLFDKILPTYLLTTVVEFKDIYIEYASPKQRDMAPGEATVRHARREGLSPIPPHQKPANAVGTTTNNMGRQMFPTSSS